MKKIIVHGGIFHADDVMTVALAKQINPNISVERVFVVPENLDEDTVVADIGFGKYDHHQEDAKVRDSGYKYAACGLFFEDYWQEIFPNIDSAYQFIEHFIIPIELQDNYGIKVSSNPLSFAISGFIPCFDEDTNMDEAFNQAVDFMECIIKRQVRKAHAEVHAKEYVEKALLTSEDGVMVLEQYVPWRKHINDSIHYVIYPSNREGWNISAVSEQDFFPEDWLEVKPEGCIFVHQGRFLSVFKTKELALKAIKLLKGGIVNG